MLLRHHFLTTGLVFLTGLMRDLAHISLGMSTQCFTGSKVGTTYWKRQDTKLLTLKYTKKSVINHLRHNVAHFPGHHAAGFLRNFMNYLIVSNGASFIVIDNSKMPVLVLTVLISSLQILSPLTMGQVSGPQTFATSFLHSVFGVSFVLVCSSILH